MAEKNRNTEQNIKEAAKLVFVAKGMAGARMPCPHEAILLLVPYRFPGEYI